MVRRVALGAVVALFASLVIPVVLAGAAGATTPVPFDTNLDVPTGSGGWFDSVSVGDLNGDGRKDIVAATDYATTQVVVYYQGAAGDLGAPVLVDDTSSPLILRVADMNGDGRQDLVTMGGGLAKIYRQQADHTLASPSTITLPPGNLVGDVVDFNHDGRPDLVVVVEGSPTSAISALLQQADGSFAPPAVIGANAGKVRLISFPDVNLDGRADVATNNGGNNITVRRQTAAGGLDTPSTIVTAAPIYSMAFADLNNDHRLDVVVGHGMSTQDQVVYRNVDFTWGSAVTLGGFGNDLGVVQVGDVNGDGLVDAAVFSSQGGVALYLQGIGGLDPAPQPVSHSVRQWENRFSAAVADVNGDGRADLVSSGYYGDLSVTENAVSDHAPVITFPMPTLQAYGSRSATITMAATDAENDPLTWDVAGGAQHGSVTVTGATFSYTATDGYVGTDAFVVRVGDGKRKFASTKVSVNVSEYAIVAGTVDDGSAPVPGVTVEAHDGSDGGLLESAITGADGTYRLAHLPGAAVKLWFHDPAGTYISEWYLNQPTEATASAFGDYPGQTLTINASLMRASAGGPISVTSTADGGEGSLRQAIGFANANPAGDTIDLQAGQTYTLTCAGGGELLSNGGALTIAGHGATIRQTCPGVRVLELPGGGQLTLSDVTLTGGDAVGDGGAVLSHSPVVLAQTTLTGNHATGIGGGIFADSYDQSLALIGSHIDHNTAPSGGGIGANNVSVDAGSIIETNTATVTGGGIYAYGLTYIDGTVRANTAGSGGGGGVLGWSWVVVRTGAKVDSNSTTGSGGGVFKRNTYGGGVLVTTGAMIASNHADGNGGGIASEETATVDRATVAGNTAGGAGGGITSPSVTLTAATVNTNSSVNGGGVSTNALIAARSTIDGNTATATGGGVTFAAGGSSTIDFSTITDNTAPTGSALAWAGAAQLRLTTSVLALPHGGSLCALGGSTVTDRNGNRVADATCGTTAPAEILASDPALGALGANGGPTATRLPADTSPLVNAVSSGTSGCTTGQIDQRGEPRPMGPGCDTGAVELARGGLRWAASIAGPFADTIAKPVVLADGATIVGGTFAGSMNGVAAAGTDGWLAKYDSGGQRQWLVTLGGAGDDTIDAVTVDGTGAIIVAGSVGNATGFQVAGTPVSVVLRGSSDSFVAKLTAAGAPTWVRTAGGTGADRALAVGVDGGGNIVVGGTFTGSATFGVVGLVASGPTDGFVARYAPAGGLWWVRRIGSTATENLADVAVSNAGVITATGGFTGTLTVAATPTALVAASAASDGWLVQFGGGGTLLRATSFGGAGAEAGTSITTGGPSGALYVTGLFHSTLTMGSGPSAQSVTSAGGSDGFLAVLAADFTPVQLLAYGGPNDDVATGAAVGADGRVAVLATLRGVSGFVNDGVAISTRNADGSVRWTQAADGPGTDRGVGVAFDPTGNLRVSVTADAAISIGISPNRFTFPSQGATNAALARLDW